MKKGVDDSLRSDVLEAVSLANSRLVQASEEKEES